MKYSLHREMFRHARQGRDTDIRRWSRNVFRHLGMTVDNEGARFSGRFIPRRAPGAATAPAAVSSATTPAPQPSSPVRPGDRPLGPARPDAPRAGSMLPARRGDPLRGTLLAGGRGAGGPGGSRETVAGGGSNDRLVGGSGNDRLDDAARTSAARREQGREGAEKRQQEQKTLDRIEDVYRGWKTYFRRQGWDKAADRLKRMLDGDGGDLVLRREEARADKFIRDGEAENRGRFVRRNILGLDGGSEENNMNDKLLKLEDGQTIELGADKWDKNFEALGHILKRGNADEALATGDSSFISEGSFTARREGDVIHIAGTVTHSWSDKYDFNSWGLGGAGALALKDAGRAKFYSVRSSWEQEVIGTVKIVDGKLTDPQFEWTDVKE